MEQEKEVVVLLLPYVSPLNESIHITKGDNSWMQVINKFADFVNFAYAVTQLHAHCEGI